MTHNRREVLCGLAGTASLAGTLGMVTSALAPRPAWAQSLNLGTLTVTSLSDGHLVLPGGMFFDGLPQDPLDAILQDAGIARDEVRPPCNLTLVQDETRTVLFDAGAGPAFMPSAGEIVDSLDALGLAPEDITHVVLTHAHPDHLWGVLDDFDDPVFYEAEHIIGQREWDYWTDPDTVESIGADRASFAVGAARRLEAIAEQVRLIQPDTEILPGILAHASYGHTPGHMSFEVRSGSQGLLVGGDAIGNHHVALARPDWPSGSDQDPDTGAATRLRLLDMLAQDKTPLLGFHLPHGGLGHIERMSEGFAFIPEGS